MLPSIHRLIARHLALLTILLIVLLLASCAPAAPTATPTPPPPAAPTPQSAVRYQTIQVPGPGSASVELPEDWKFWGNGGWLSPDGGQTLGGLRLVFLQPGKDSGRLLYNEGAVLIDQSPVTIGEVQATRYKIQSFMTNASTGQRVLEGYELIYAIPYEKEGLLAGVFVRAQGLEDLEKLEPVVQHMAESLKVGKE